jgi:NAD(P)-dependent dehydrogenase (short-subunit alcohol dehydrogenase family)
MDAQRLKGNVAIVTGPDSEIGRAIAFAFAKEGRIWRRPISTTTRRL